MLKHKKNMNTIYSGVLGHRGLSRLVAFLGMLFVIGHANGQMTSNFVPQEAKKEISGQPAPDDRFMAFDQKNWKRPQSSFNWVVMARDIKVPWDSFGRQGWMTDDAYVEPVDPGVSEFSPDTDLFYIVFSVSGMDAPSQFRAAWYFMPDGKTAKTEYSGTDALFLEMNEKAGYLEVFRPEDGWEKGKYLLKIFYESPGQDLYEGNVVGTMVFTITDVPSS